jgi:hypothetical protein
VAAAIVLSLLASVLLAIMLLSPAAENSAPENPAPVNSPLEPGSNTTTEVGVEWVIGSCALAILAIVLSVFLTARRQAIVIPRSQKDAPPFWERNRDEIAINAIFTVIGAGLGIAATLLVQSLGR